MSGESGDMDGMAGLPFGAGPAAAALRRAELLEHVMGQVRGAMLAPAMMGAVLDPLLVALDAQGGLVVDLLAGPDRSPVLHAAGADPGPGLPGMVECMAMPASDLLMATVLDLPVLACPGPTRHGGHAGICVWRAAGGAAWTQDDARTLRTVATLVFLVLEHEAIQRELALQTRTDPLTGMLNRRSFLVDVTRRIDRLQRDGLPGVLMTVTLDHLRRLNDASGFDTGDRALVLAATLLHATVRGADVVARLGAGEFALWLDGSDAFAAAERADELCREAADVFAAALPPDAPPVSLSIGVAARYPVFAEMLDGLMRRSGAAMDDAKRAGGGRWRVAPDPAA